jgi:hypothetical protein
MGHENLWMLKAALEDGQSLSDQPSTRPAGKSQHPIDKGRVAP